MSGAMSTPEYRNDPPEDNSIERLREVMKGLDTAVLMTVSDPSQGKLHGRPMSIAAFEDDACWFFTGIDSPKVGEAQADPEAYVVCQDASRQVVMRGNIGITRDRERMEKYYSKAVEVWFPDGLDDPKLCLMHFVPLEAEYWDLSGTKKLRYLFEAAKAFVKGEAAEPLPHQHGKVLTL